MTKMSRPSPPSSSSAASNLDSKAFDSPHGYPDSKMDDDDARFDRSLRELRDLPCQLRYAADYCEMAFLKAKQKNKVLENTKEYVCRAMVTMVDHLGSISANLEGQFSDNKQISDTQIRIHCLNQRLLTCQDYTQKLALSKVQWHENRPRYNKRYMLPKADIPDLEKAPGVLRFSDDSTVPRTSTKFKLNTTKEQGSLLLNSYSHRRNSSSGLSSVIPVLDNSIMLSVPRNCSFHFQEAKKAGHKERSRRMLQIPWRNKRSTA